MADADGDGQQGVSLKTSAMQVLVDPAEGGALTEWSLSGARLNLLDTLARRPEPYHDKLRLAKVSSAAAASGQGVASIHDALGVKEEHLESYLVYDDHRRSAFLDYALQSMPRLEDAVRATWGERRLWSLGPYEVERAAADSDAGHAARVTMTRIVLGHRVRKTVRLTASQPTLSCLYELEGPDVPVVALEFNFSLRDERYLRQAQQREQVRQFDISEPATGIVLQVAMEPAATLFHFPIETVSESEGGLERTYQGLCLLCCWPLEGATSWKARLDWTVEPA